LVAPAAVLGVAVAVLPAVASSEPPALEAVNEGGGVYERHRWSPAQVTVSVGGAVTFRNSSEVPHGVEWRSAIKPSCEEGTGKVPVGTTPAASGRKWSGACTFSQPGTYTFYCTVHGPEMTGTITVNAESPTPTTTTAPATTSAPGTTTPGPSSSLLIGGPSLRSGQRGGTVRGSLEVSQAGAGGRLEVDLFASSASLATAGHSTRVRVGRLVHNSVSAGKVPFAVGLTPRARKALKRHHRLALTVKITLTPLHGTPLNLTRVVIEHG
jgi:plastocyanin